MIYLIYFLLKNMIDRHNMVSYIASDEISSLMSLNSDNCDVVYNRRWVLDTKIIDHILINNKSGGNIPGIYENQLDNYK
jgi:hypothetical protein